jgi:aminoglycoside 6'-N-acetyltransferase
MSHRNRTHLARYEAENVALSIYTQEEAEALVQELAADWTAGNCFFLGAFERATGEFVAQIYLGPVNWDLPEFEIGYFADRDHQRQGFVTEAVQAVVRIAFEHLHAHRLRIECDDTNVPSCRVAERCGFVREGYIRENKLGPDGTLSGTVHYGLLKSDRWGGWRDRYEEALNGD